MKQHIRYALTCGALLCMSPLNASKTYKAVDLGPSVAQAFGVTLYSIEIIPSGMNGNGVVYGAVRSGSNQSGFVWNHGSVSIYSGTTVNIAGVSLAGEVAVTDGSLSYVHSTKAETVSFPSSQQASLSVLSMNDRGEAIVFDSRRAMYGVWTTLNGMSDVHAASSVVGNVTVDFHPLSIGYDGSLYGMAYRHTDQDPLTSYRVVGGVLETNLFGTAAQQAIDWNEGVVLGVRHPMPDRTPTVFVGTGNSVSLTSNITPSITALVKDATGTHNLQNSTPYAIPFALSENGTLATGVTFQNIPAYRNGLDGAVALWRGTEKIDLSIETSKSLSVRDGLDVTNSGTVLARATRDGIQTASVLIPVSFENPTIQKVPHYQDRLAILSATGPVAVTPESLAGKNVVVLVHGWAPGFTDDLNVNPNLKAWDANARWYFDIADKFRDEHTVVLGYSWVDGSATASMTEASMSRANTDMFGELLYRSVSEIAGSASSIEFIAHSHGSRVTLVGASRLEERGIDVSSITMLDSPESPMTLPGVASSLSGGENVLQPLLNAYATRFGIGLNAGQTHVANFYSLFGEAYSTTGVVNTKLEYTDLSSAHSYPIEWLAREGMSESELTSPLAHPLGVLVQSPLNVFAIDGTQQWIQLSGELSGSSDTIELSPQNTDWSALISLNDEAYQSIEIGYSLNDSSNDSVLSFWIDDENISSVISSQNTDDEWKTASIPVRGIEGLRRLGMYLRGSGNATVRSIAASHFVEAPVSTPEPSLAVLGCIGVAFVILQRRRSGAALPLKNKTLDYLHYADVF